MLVGSHFIGKFIDNGYNYFNNNKHEGIIIPDMYVDDSISVLEVVDRGRGLAIFDKKDKYRFNPFNEIKNGYIIMISKFNVLPMIVENGDDSDYYIGSMQDVLGIIPN